MQVNASSFGKFEDGNTLTFDDLEAWIDADILPQWRAAHAHDGAAAEPAAAAAAATLTPGAAVAVPPHSADAAMDEADGTPALASAAADAGESGAGCAPGEVKAAAGAAAGCARSKFPKTSDKPLWQAVSGEEALWGCGRHGMWAQMRAAARAGFEALRGLGGARTHGYEEYGFARRPPGYISSTPAGSVEAEAARPESATAGPAGAGLAAAGPNTSRHRFEFLGLDFIADADGHIYLYVHMRRAHQRNANGCDMLCGSSRKA